MIAGLITNIQRYSVHDGPGIRTTVFLKGCPLACAWCHNPETINPRPHVMRVEARCIRCGSCLAACPRGDPVGLPSAVKAGFPSVTPQPGAPAECSVCAACIEACPVNGRTLVGRELTPAALRAELLHDRLFFDESRGGVTFSGGEPLRQGEFLLAALALCCEEGIHTAVDTCGHAPRELVQRVAAACDLVLYDLKLLDADRHARFCGASNRLILENLHWLARHHPRVWLRIPLIPEVNGDPGELAAMARLAASLPAVEQVNLLPYHAIGTHKRDGLATHPPPAFKPPSTPQIEAARRIFEQAGLRVCIGG
ncbi:MAG: glycyl-radical enzyme activating protein [Verrucomicrobiales bacterium]|nr:glycyl-radical enzyme activating protein [Verrucomicrobiales bacterium]MCP5525678.1 glycyl-radical enzyme activating protein [Verrucomicrobiales bacterium]